MAQLDRFLSVLVSNNGSALILSEGDIAAMMIKDSPRPVMKQPLTSAQILTLLREIAPANQPRSLDASGGMRFEYSSADGIFDVSMTQNGKITARIERKSAGSTPTAATAPAAAPHPTPVVSAPATTHEAPRAEASQSALTGNKGLDKIEGLLRTLISSKASDLHLRAGSPPMIRAHGEIAGRHRRDADVGHARPESRRVPRQE